MPHLQCNGEVLQVYGSCWIHGRSNTHRPGALIPYQATHTMRHGVASQTGRSAQVAGNVLCLPTNVVKFVVQLVLSRVLLLLGLLLLLHLYHNLVSHALGMDATFLVAREVELAPHRKPALVAEVHLLPVRVLGKEVGLLVVLLYLHLRRGGGANHECLLQLNTDLGLGLLLLVLQSVLSLLPSEHGEAIPGEVAIFDALPSQMQLLTVLLQGLLNLGRILLRGLECRGG
mmetsp:Transcript_38941/g.87491  ORF Transcript_38941/g.87491 Transcript_38941/m.87491 type:complete len:230 (+) Transcript_38941:2407-3096(+)